MAAEKAPTAAERQAAEIKRWREGRQQREAEAQRARARCEEAIRRLAEAD